MLIQELQQSIINVDTFYKYGDKLIFTGEETYLQKLYVNQLAKAWECKVVYSESYLEVKRSVTTTTMMDKNKLFVIRNSAEFTKNPELFKNIVCAKNKWLILIFDKLDKRSVFFKENELLICEFEKMTDAQLLRIIRKNYPTLAGLSDENCYTIIDLVNRDYGRLLLELDKLKTMLNILEVEGMEAGYDADSNEWFEFLMNDGLIHQDIDNDTFKLVDAILNKDYINSYRLLKNAKNGEFDVFSLMGLLYANYKNTLLYKCSKDVNLSSFVKNKINGFISKYNINELIKKLQIIQEIEQGIKLGKVDSELSDEILLVRIFNEGGR